MKTLKKYSILIPIIILNIISLLYLYQTPYFLKQTIFIIIGFISLFTTSMIPLSELKTKPFLIYLISILLLTLVLIIGKEINGSKAWLHIFHISIQPSEITKLVLSFYIPYLIQNKKILFAIIATIIPSILTYLEPDTGAILFYFIILGTSLLYANINKKIWIISIILICLLSISHIYLYINNKDFLIKIYSPKLFYRIDRFISFKKGNNIQNINSLISIGSHNLLYIPENHNDFIFASILSTSTSITFLITLLSYITIFLYFLNNMNIYNHIYLNILIFQVFYNIFMNLSLLPIIGIPLPFISYGGSYLITLYIAIGILIHINNKKVHYNKVHNKDYT